MTIENINLKRLITSDDILGKDVIDKDGNTVGIVEKVLIDPIGLDIVGIEVDKGFLKKGLSVGKGYIEKVSKHAILLNIRVAHEIRGMQVFDNAGRKIGMISEVRLHENKNKIEYLVLKISNFKKEMNIPPEAIAEIGYNLVLNISKEQLIKINNKSN